MLIMAEGGTVTTLLVGPENQPTEPPQPTVKTFPRAILSLFDDNLSIEDKSYLMSHYMPIQLSYMNLVFDKPIFTTLAGNYVDYYYELR